MELSTLAETISSCTPRLWRVECDRRPAAAAVVAMTLCVCWAAVPGACCGGNSQRNNNSHGHSDKISELDCRSTGAQDCVSLPLETGGGTRPGASTTVVGGQLTQLDQHIETLRRHVSRLEHDEVWSEVWSEVD